MNCDNCVFVELKFFLSVESFMKWILELKEDFLGIKRFHSKQIRLIFEVRLENKFSLISSFSNYQI